MSGAMVYQRRRGHIMVDMGPGHPVRCALLLIALVLPSVAAADAWDEAYKRGFDACIHGDWKLGAVELERAIADAPNEFITAEPKNGLTVYVPHYWLGCAKYNIGDYTGALREFRISEKQGVTLKNSDYVHGLPNWIAKVKAEIAFAQAGEARKHALRAGGDRIEAYRKGQKLLQEAKDTFNKAGLATDPFLRAYDLAMEARALFVAARDEATKPAPTPVRPQPVPAPVTTPAPTTGTAFPADEELKWAANIAFDTPDEINLDQHRVIKLLMDVHKSAKELERELHEPKTATAAIKISDSVEAHLVGAAFDIRPITLESQEVSAEETTQWQWEVTPKQEGTHRLFLTINAVLGSGPGQRRRSIRTFDRTIDVRVPPRSAKRWIVPIALLAGIVVASLLFLAFRRRTPPEAAADATLPVTVTTIQTPTTRPLAATRFLEGQLIGGRYRIVRLLGQGGMGAVYAAEDREFGGELVALKTIRALGEDADAVLARFKKEIQLARRVAHPNVCRIYDVGYHITGHGERTIFVSMEYIRGVPLKSVIQEKGRLNELEALAIIRDVAAALDATHAAGLIHRDVKSGNVMLAEKGGRAVLMDFGVACLSNPDGDEASLTRTGAIIGTPAYMSPEQIEGGTLTAATDIYAFGMIIYEMVTGRLPYEGDTPMSILAKRLRERLTSPVHFVPNLRREWERAILTCLEIDPAKRFRSAMEVSRTLERAAGAEPTLAM